MEITCEIGEVLSALGMEMGMGMGGVKDGESSSALVIARKARMRLMKYILDEAG